MVYKKLHSCTVFEYQKSSSSSSDVVTLSDNDMMTKVLSFDNKHLLDTGLL